jgi:hypothetical protein
MKLYVAAAAAFAAVLPAAPALAHCRTVHHRVAVKKVAYHRVAHAAPVRHRAVRTACACDRRVVHRTRVYREAYYEPAAYPVVYRPRLVTVAYARPAYRPYRPIYADRYYRARPHYYGARYERFPRYGHYRSGGYRHDRFARFDGYGRHDRYAWR